MARRRKNSLPTAAWVGIGIAAALYLIARATNRGVAQALTSQPRQLGSGT